MTHDEMIAVIKAHKEGKTIEARPVRGGRIAWRDWGVTQLPAWDFRDYEYRVKKEPLRFWATVDIHNKVIGLYDNQVDAHRWARSPGDRVVGLVEVPK